MATKAKKSTKRTAKKKATKKRRTTTKRAPKIFTPAPVPVTTLDAPCAFCGCGGSNDDEPLF